MVLKPKDNPKKPTPVKIAEAKVPTQKATLFPTPTTDAGTTTKRGCGCGKR